mmetsp:Transcript_23036/g.22191  ORF Transcript_23036/g.22191 Transcript_23036/m.22191 type:complete len:158 (-) Transcript_23036:432-905(-)
MTSVIFASLLLVQIFSIVYAHNSTVGICPRGSFRGNAIPTCMLCPMGVYGETSGLTSAQCSAPCPIGTYNDIEGRQTPADCKDCPIGVYGDTVGLTTRKCTGPCPIGTYSRTTKLTTPRDCIPCPQGYYMYQCNLPRSFPAGVGFVPRRADIINILN